MLALFVKQYGLFLFSTIFALVALFLIGIYFIFKLNPSSKKIVNNKNEVKAQSSTQDFEKNNNPLQQMELQNLARLTLPTLSEQKEIDFSDIAGEDVIATQLDLARAYIETGKKKTAKKILNQVILKGSKSQQEEAKVLLQL